MDTCHLFGRMTLEVYLQSLQEWNTYNFIFGEKNIGLLVDKAFGTPIDFGDSTNLLF